MAIKFTFICAVELWEISDAFLLKYLLLSLVIVTTVAAADAKSLLDSYL